MKILPWILVGGGAFTMLAGWLASRAKASVFSTFTTSETTMVGGFTVPGGVTLSANEQSAMTATPTDPHTPGLVHHDLQEAFDYYIAHRASDGSVTAPNGMRFANLQALLATGGG